MGVKEQLVNNGLYVKHDFMSASETSELENFFKLEQTRPGVVEFKESEVLRSDNKTLKEVFKIGRAHV